MYRFCVMPNESLNLPSVQSNLLWLLYNLAGSVAVNRWANNKVEGIHRTFSMATIRLECKHGLKNCNFSADERRLYYVSREMHKEIGKSCC